jgi:hypothetical protein
VAALEAGPPVQVRRLHRSGSYLLVPLRDEEGLCGIVRLDAETLAVEASAAIRDRSTAFLAPEDAVLAAAQTALPGRTGWRRPVLAWRPCRESFDAMRPLWLVAHDAGEVYVTQGLEVHEALTSGRGG